MTEETENIVLELLRRIRASQERMEQDIADLKARMSSVELVLGQQQIQLAALNARMDRSDERLGRIERRLELVNA
jgi:predicted  nucleic acid-binding Zn-ribbon protein